jgi:hypothetical protein
MYVTCMLTNPPQLILALWHGTFIFVPDPTYGWYLSSTATLLFISYQLHNVVSWLKIRPFLPRWGSRFFIFSLLAVQPFWVVECWSNFEYFNHLGSNANIRIRPWEALLRDPWWIFTTWKLLEAIKKTYSFGLWALVRINRRFGVLLACMFLSIAFLLTDIGVSAARATASSGINPFWRFALVFKCAADTIFLDDFKSVLDDILAHRLGVVAGSNGSNGSRRYNSGSRTVQTGSQSAKRSIELAGPASSETERGSTRDGRGPEAHLLSSLVPARPSSIKWMDPFKNHRRKQKKAMRQVPRNTDDMARTVVRVESHAVYDEERPPLSRPLPAVHSRAEQI